MLPRNHEQWFMEKVLFPGLTGQTDNHCDFPLIVTKEIMQIAEKKNDHSLATLSFKNGQWSLIQVAMFRVKNK